MNKQEEVHHLFQKYLEGSITNIELKKLFYLVEGLPGELFLRQEIERHFKADGIDHEHLEESAKQIEASSWQGIKAHINTTQQPKPNFKLWFYALAGAIIIIPFIANLLLNYKHKQDQTLSKIKSDIPPGTNRATLTLANGKRYELNEKQQGIILTKNGFSYTDGTPINTETESQEATITVPRAGQYNVTLADGTKVKLNAASTLTYATKFTGKERLVALAGEAYFEVAKNKHQPFKVVGNGQVITVLGTHFNVHAYQNEPIETTLLEGSISIQKNTVNSKSMLLKPGQQARQNEKGFAVSNVDARETIAWADNLFVFNNMALPQIMKQLERWYDVEVIYPDHIAKETFYAEIPKDRKLSQVLAALEQSGKLKFKLDGRRLTVSQ